MKSFHVYWKAPENKPSRHQHEYSAEELNRFKELFAPTAAKFRKHTHIQVVLILLAMASVVILVVRQDMADEWILAPLAVIFTVIIGGSIVFPEPTCPGCNNSLSDIPREYCPECGSRTLRRKYRFFFPIQCLSCGKTLTGGKGRRYKIRACTHCGIHLDDKGF